jgi:hypothetical protein
MPTVRSPNLGSALAWLIQQSVYRTGRPVALAALPWLDGPLGTGKIGAAIYADFASQRRLTLSRDHAEAGLLADFERLKGPTFDPALVDPAIHEFYEHTARFTFDVWSQWHGPLQPFAKLLVALVSRDMEQFNFLLTPLETSRGITSEIIRLVDPATGEVPYAGWLRTSASTGLVVYAGFYAVCAPPNAPGPCVKVVFPVPSGATTVLLHPENRPDGSLVLRSSHDGFGGSGFYRLHHTGQGDVHARTFPLTERIHVYRDPQDILRTDHLIAYWGMRLLTLHYKITCRR